MHRNEFILTTLHKQFTSRTSYFISSNFIYLYHVQYIKTLLKEKQKH